MVVEREPLNLRTALRRLFEDYDTFASSRAAPAELAALNARVLGRVRDLREVADAHRGRN